MIHAQTNQQTNLLEARTMYDSVHAPTNKQSHLPEAKLMPDLLPELLVEIGEISISRVLTAKSLF